jgi:hypothetical protein
MNQTITIRATEHGPRWDGNTHRMILKCETEQAFIGWPDATDKRNSPNWNPATDKPMTYPKFAWEIVPPCEHCTQSEGHTLECPINPAWLEYDAAARDLARKGLTGAIGDSLPNLMTPDACAMIDADPEAFQERVRLSAYALAMGEL